MAEALARLQALLDAEPDARGSVVERLDRLLARSPEAARQLGIVPVAGEAQLASARFTAELLGDPEAMQRRPSFEEDVAVIEWVLRPAIPYTGLKAAADAGIWPGLADMDLTDVARRCCRIDVGPMWTQRVHVGSGFLLVSDAHASWVVTAAHVTSALEVAGWDKPGGPRAWAWCGAEEPGNASDALELHGQVRAHALADLSVVAVDANSVASVAAGGSAAVETGSLIAVCGYPFFDSRRDSWARSYGFRDPASVLRISPGVTRRTVTRSWSGTTLELIEHDAATLSGSSGSLVIDLPGLRLAGVHVGGWPTGEADGPFETNVAVPQRRIAELV